MDTGIMQTNCVQVLDEEPLLIGTGCSIIAWIQSVYSVLYCLFNNNCIELYLIHNMHIPLGVYAAKWIQVPQATSKNWCRHICSRTECNFWMHTYYFKYWLQHRSLHQKDFQCLQLLYLSSQIEFKYWLQPKWIQVMVAETLLQVLDTASLPASKVFPVPSIIV